LKPIRAEVRYITIEYALWDGRWWLPRLLAMDGVATMGSFIEAPLKFERTYTDYKVEGDSGAPTIRAAVAADDSAEASCTGRANCHCEGQQLPRGGGHRAHGHSRLAREPGAAAIDSR